MERSESKTGSEIPFRVRNTESSTQIKPYYRVHAGNSGSSATEQPIEATLSHADALLQHEWQSCTEPMLSLVIPTYNAQRWLPALLENLLALQAEKEILIVDDGSTDSTLSVVKALGEKHPEITLLQHDTHLGRCAALQTGLAASFGKVVVVLDGVTDIKNKDIVMLVKPILAGCCDVVY
ncbi:MAG: glycosyltransferase family 2 protein, partial [Pirellulales bacterium]|nr:glycosyltransferase family 2 protein [Pirellulales bacterium]